MADKELSDSLTAQVELLKKLGDEMGNQARRGELATLNTAWEAVAEQGRRQLSQEQKEQEM